MELVRALWKHEDEVVFFVLEQTDGTLDVVPCGLGRKSVSR